MAPSFCIERWAAFAPGLLDQSAWLAWARAAEPWLPVGDEVPSLSEMPAMQRRRLERLGRMALQVAWQCQADAEVDCPQVFASRHGDVGRTYTMLEELATEGTVSPTQFGLSTHNAIAAQYSIARQFVGNYQALSAGNASAEAAVSEACALLADGAPAALVVIYDAPLPAGYAAFDSEAQAAYSWALRLTPATADSTRFSLSCQPAGNLPSNDSAEPVAVLLPHGLQVLHFLLGDDPELRHTQGDCRWLWRRET